MSFSRKTKVGRAKRELKQRLRCPKCKSLDVATTDYPDALLLVCQTCSFPRRWVKGEQA